MRYLISRNCLCPVRAIFLRVLFLPLLYFIPPSHSPSPTIPLALVLFLPLFFSPFFSHRRKMISFGNWARWTAVKWPAGSSFIPERSGICVRARLQNLSPPWPLQSIVWNFSLLVYPEILVARATILVHEHAT